MAWDGARVFHAAFLWVVCFTGVMLSIYGGLSWSIGWCERSWMGTEDTGLLQELAISGCALPCVYSAYRFGWRWQTLRLDKCSSRCGSILTNFHDYATMLSEGILPEPEHQRGNWCGEQLNVDVALVDGDGSARSISSLEAWGHGNWGPKPLMMITRIDIGFFRVLTNSCDHPRQGILIN